MCALHEAVGDVVEVLAVHDGGDDGDNEQVAADLGAVPPALDGEEVDEADEADADNGEDDLLAGGERGEIFGRRFRIRHHGGTVGVFVAVEHAAGRVVADALGVDDEIADADDHKANVHDHAQAETGVERQLGNALGDAGRPVVHRAGGEAEDVGHHAHAVADDGVIAHGVRHENAQRDEGEAALANAHERAEQGGDEADDGDDDQRILAEAVYGVIQRDLKDLGAVDDAERGAVNQNDGHNGNAADKALRDRHEDLQETRGVLIDAHIGIRIGHSTSGSRVYHIAVLAGRDDVGQNSGNDDHDKDDHDGVGGFHLGKMFLCHFLLLLAFLSLACLVMMTNRTMTRCAPRMHLQLNSGRIRSKCPHGKFAT